MLDQFGQVFPSGVHQNVAELLVARIRSGVCVADGLVEVGGDAVIV